MATILNSYKNYFFIEMKDSCFWFTALAAIGGCACGLIYMRYRNNNEKEESSSKESSYVSLIGNTPLVKLEKLSEMIHRDIYVKVLVHSFLFKNIRLIVLWSRWRV